MKWFAYKTIFWMTGLFLFLFGGSFLVFSFFIDFFGVFLSENQQNGVFFFLGILAFVFVVFLFTLPLKRANDFLKLLLSQPKTENIRVIDVEFKDDFKIGEWGEFGNLVRQVEIKLRRRTKALLRETTELSAVINSLGSPIVAVNSDLGVGFLNSAFAVLFDLSSEDLVSIKSKKIGHLISEDELILILNEAICEEVFETKTLEIQIGGRPRIFSVSMNPLRREDGSLYGVVASLNDETVKVEMSRKQMDFVANASHELRTPISAISTSINLLSRIEAPETKKQIMNSLESNSKRLVALTNELLDLSKLEGEVEDLELSFCDLRKLTEEVVGNLSHPGKKHIEFRFEAKNAYFDESKVKQVLQNLIRNALVYTPEDTKILVSWSEEREGTFLKVKDEGTGVLEESHGRIFERFYRVDKGRSRKVGGSGIGLSIVKHIMSLHGGEIKLAPYKKDEGAEFICFFPFKTMSS